MGIGLYIHVPFCRQKCPYCDFYSLRYNEDTVKAYTLSVLRNLEQYANRCKTLTVDTIYFGGGTPSLLPTQYLDSILTKIRECFTLENPEITLEANPCTITLEGLQALHFSGFNRISMGIQSLCDDELKTLGRLHDSQTALKALKIAHEAGFTNISADLMIGIIGQDLYSLDKNIQILSELELTHISAYILKIEPGTPYEAPKYSDHIPDEDSSADLYLHTVKALGQAGFMQYEISNFCRPGFESRHNLHYWRCEEYIGIGPAAHSYFQGKRYAVPRNNGYRTRRIL